MKSPSDIVEGEGWIWLCVSICASFPFWDGWPHSFGYLEWLCSALLVPQPVFVLLAMTFLLTEQPCRITEEHPDPDPDPRKLY
jgi:hypothetical protein